MDNNEPKKKVVYGRIAEQFRQAVIADEVKRLTEKKKADEEKVPEIISDPQGMIIRGRLRRFKPAILTYAKNFCLHLISEDDFLLAVKGEARRMLTSVRSMGRIRISATQVEQYSKDIVYTLARMLQDVPEAAIEINMATPLVDAVMSMIEQVFAERAALPDHEKLGEGKETAVSEDDPLKDFPPDIRALVVERLVMLGLNPRDIDTIKRFARQMGVDPEEAIEEMKQGRIPEKLRKFF
jgi:hypothetical protein